MKQKRAKPGDPLIDDTTNIGNEEIAIPDIGDALKQADEALAEQRQPIKRRRVRLCPLCRDERCRYTTIEEYWE